MSTWYWQLEHLEPRYPQTVTVPVASFGQDVNVANDGVTSDDFQENFSLPAGLAAGVYYMSVQATPAGSDGLNTPNNFNAFDNSNVLLTVGQDGSVTVAQQSEYGWGRGWGWGVITCPIEIYGGPFGGFGYNQPIFTLDSGALSTGGNISSAASRPQHINVPVLLSGATSAVRPDGALNYSVSNMGMTPIPTGSNTADIRVDSSASRFSILAGAPIQTNFQSIAATLAKPGVTLADAIRPRRPRATWLTCSPRPRPTAPMPEPRRISSITPTTPCSTRRCISTRDRVASFCGTPKSAWGCLALSVQRKGTPKRTWGCHRSFPSWGVL